MMHSVIVGKTLPGFRKMHGKVVKMSNFIAKPICNGCDSVL